MHITPPTHDCERLTHFILLVNIQMEALESDATTSAAPSPVITFPLHVNLGFAICMPAQ